MPAQAASLDPVAATELWFVKRGLPYFVPSERAAARQALHPRRTVPLVLVTAVAAVGLAVLLTWLSGDRTFAPATLTFIGVVAGLAYAVTALRARPILTWAVKRTLASLRELLPMVTRALPLLVVFVTFLFINAEVWHVSANLDGGVLWLTVLLFLLMGIGFFLVRLPDEIDRADDELDDARIVEVTQHSPLGGEVGAVAAAEPGLLASEVEVTGFERANLTVALVVIQLSQVLLVALSLLLFFLVFGAIAMKRSVVEVWIGEPTNHLPGVVNVSVELLQVSVFLAAFSAFYISVYAVTDETYRGQFFTGVMRELELAVAVRAAYVALTRDRDEHEAGAAPVSTGADPDPTVPFQPVEGASGVEVLGDERRDPL
jgi:hypothetical protein